MVFNFHNSDCNICILGMGMAYLEFGYMVIRLLLGYFLIVHWDSFVTHTWQPCIYVTTFKKKKKVTCLKEKNQMTNFQDMQFMQPINI